LRATARQAILLDESEGCRGVAKGEAGPELGQENSQEGEAVIYVYILESEQFSHFYVGLTDNLRARVRKHNSGGVPHTSKYLPWRLKTYVAFSSVEQGRAFERYLKTASGRAFAKKRL
jgi:predicted GIY-YIG superfamily endonuclease